MMAPTGSISTWLRAPVLRALQSMHAPSPFSRAAARSYQDTPASTEAVLAMGSNLVRILLHSIAGQTHYCVALLSVVRKLS